MEASLTQRESPGTQPHSQQQSLTRTLRTNFLEHSNTSRYNNNISTIFSTADGLDNSDPSLLVTESNSRRPPSRPKNLIMLILIAIFDLCIITTYALLSWNNSWDLVGLGIFRIIVVLGVTSSVWIRDLGWILGGACGVSSLYIIFKTNFLVQSKHPFEGFLFVLFLTSFFFCQIYWIAFNIIITNKKVLRDSNTSFEEEEEEYSQSSPLNTLRKGLTLNSNTRTYGATVDSSDDIDILINDREISSSAIDILTTKSNNNSIRTSNTSISASLPIPIASSVGGSAKSLNRYKKKMKLQDSEFSLNKRKSRNISEEIQDDEQLNVQENGINNTSRTYPIKVDADNDPLLLNDDSLLLNDDYGDEGLIVTSIGCGGSVRDRYFQPALDNESGDENDETIAAEVGDSCSDSNDEFLSENRHEKTTKYIEINSDNIKNFNL